MIEQSPVSVIIPCLNEAETIGRALEGVRRQTLQPRRVLVTDGGSTDGTLRILEDWKDQLPLTMLDNPDQRQAPGINRALKEVTADYVARLDGHSFWNPTYLETLVEALHGDERLAAAGGLVTLPDSASSFQRDAWAVMEHPLGTGAPTYRTSPDPSKVESVQSPVYRREALEDVGGVPEDLPWAEDDELHRRLRTRGWQLHLEPDALLYYSPRDTHASFVQQFYYYGQGRGRLGSRGLFPSDRHLTIDRTLKLWTIGLCWNPVGWGLLVFYLMADVVITIEQCLRGKSTPRFLYLLPLVQTAYWLGWVTTRFPLRKSPSG